MAQERQLYLYLAATSYKYVTRKADPDDSWSRDSTAKEWTVQGVRLLEKDEYGCVPVDFPVQVGDTVHVLYAVYGTGDTFGHDDGEYLEFLSAHKNYEVAQRNLESVQGRSLATDQYTMTLEFDSGAKVKRNCPWDGYFESLDYVRLETFVVQGPEHNFF